VIRAAGRIFAGIVFFHSLDESLIRQRSMSDRGAALAAPAFGVLRTYYHHALRAGQESVWSTLMSHRWWAEREVGARPWFGARMSVNAQEIVGRYIANFGIWEPSLTAWLMSHLQPGDTFVDVGANIGYVTLLASRVVGAAGCVISIEPSPANSAMLRRNVAANHAENVRVVQAPSRTERASSHSMGRVDGKVTLEAEWARAHGLKQIGSVPPGQAVVQRRRPLPGGDQGRRGRPRSQCCAQPIRFWPTTPGLSSRP
jgi:FkbM family methyltransferase